MSFVVYGCSHKTTSLGNLERLSVPAEDVPKTLAHLASLSSVLEGAFVSTCNRVEVYSVVSHFHQGVADLREFLAGLGGFDPDEVSSWAYLKVGKEAYQHLFRVAAGLDSMALGETEIQGQLKRALALAREAGTAGRYITRAFERAAAVGKSVRRRTGISREPLSIPAAAVALAERELGGLSGRTAAVVGAGEAGRVTALALEKAGARISWIVNRSSAPAESVASQVGADVARLDDLPEVIATVDLVVTSTDSPHVVVPREAVEKAFESGRSRRLLIIDIAVPRDVEPSCADLQSVTLRDLEDLEEVIAEARAKRAREALLAEEIVDAETEKFLMETKADQYSETISLLKARFEAVVDAEVAKLRRRARSRSTYEVDVAEQTARSVANKLLHLPVSKLKEAAVADKAELLAEALSYLFDLDVSTDRPLGSHWDSLAEEGSADIDGGEEMSPR